MQTTRNHSSIFVCFALKFLNEIKKGELHLILRKQYSVLRFTFIRKLLIIQLMKKQINRICHLWPISNIKQRQAYLKRQELSIENTPKIKVGNLDNLTQQIWTEDLKNQIVLLRLKELNSSQLAYSYARKIIMACIKLAPIYGFFIINENMVFFNQKKDIFVWINPEILQNKVKIYLPNNQSGELMMVRSIITYLKLWLKIDYVCMADVKLLKQLLKKFDMTIFKNSIKIQPTVTVKKSVTNENTFGNQIQNLNLFERNAISGLRIFRPFQSYQLNQNRSNRELHVNNIEKEGVLTERKEAKLLRPQFLSKDSLPKHQRGNKKKTFFFQDYTTTKITDQKEQNLTDQTQKDHSNNRKLQVNKSMGIINDSHSFPSQSCSNRRHPIVQLIKSQDIESDHYKSNRLLLDDDKLTEELQRQRLEKMSKMKESLCAFGDEINKLFVSNIMREEEKEADLMKIQQQFGNLFI